MCQRWVLGEEAAATGGRCQGRCRFFSFLPFVCVGIEERGSSMIKLNLLAVSDQRRGW